MYHGSGTEEQHFDAPCQPDNVIVRALEDSVSNDVFVSNIEMGGEGFEDGPCEVNLKRVPIMLGED